jgi:hypothetical protein
MKLEEVYIARMVGGVFFDRLASVSSKKEWGDLCEQVRPSVREVLSGLNIHGKMDITIAEEGFRYDYDWRGTQHTISVSQSQVAFDYARFKVCDGVPEDIPAVVEKVLEKIQRKDWIEIGSLIGLVFPAKSARESTVGMDLLMALLLVRDRSLDAALRECSITQVDLTIRGRTQGARVVWNIYNQEDQSTVITVDKKAYRHEMGTGGIRDFAVGLFETFMERCKSLAEEILTAQSMAPYLDIEFLTKGVR